ncbi:MAG: hypothetical protein HY537_02385 [Deltaproteobacteria bacterium]|nr:hypothetical protein [Deltaproteobacteria bacterium]
MKRAAFFFIIWLALISLVFISQSANAESRKPSSYSYADMSAENTYKRYRSRTKQSTTKNDELPRFSDHKPTKKMARTYASYEPGSRTWEKVRQTPIREQKEVEFRLGLLGGIAKDQSISDSIYQFGLAGDLRATYFRMELDGYYGFLPAKTENISFENIRIESKTSTQQYGGMFDLNGQLPFFTGKVKWIPKLGAGYGLHVSKTTAEEFIDDVPINTNTTTQIHGPYVTAGLEIDIASLFILMGDYARTLGSLGTSAKIDPLIEGEPAKSAQFERIRAGLYFRLADHFIVGGQFVRRATEFKISNAETTYTSSTSQNHYLGMLMLEL